MFRAERLSAIGESSPIEPISSNGGAIQLNLGLDFGTCFTKVVVGEMRERYAVPFHGLNLENPYLLPSVLYVSPESNVCSLRSSSKYDKRFHSLKMPLINRSWTHDDVVRTGAYLALVIRYAREWLLVSQGLTYEGRKIEWFINVGLPTESFEDEELTSVYGKIVRASWRVSEHGEIITLDDLASYIPRDDDAINQSTSEGLDCGLPQDRFNLFPEFAAQLTGYLQSPRRQNELHVTVDVGGGTMDTTIFIVHEKLGEDTFSVLARKVEPYGVSYLAEARRDGLSKLAEWDNLPFLNFPTDESLRRNFGISKEELSEVDAKLRIKIGESIQNLLKYTKQHRYQPSEWILGRDVYGNPVRSFYTGGGVLTDFYANLLRAFEDGDPPCKLREAQVPIPDDLRLLDENPIDFGRLAVAYGLSWDPFDIGKVETADKIPNLEETRTQRDIRDNYFGPEKM